MTVFSGGCISGKLASSNILPLRSSLVILTIYELVLCTAESSTRAAFRAHDLSGQSHTIVCLPQIRSLPHNIWQ